MSDGWARAAFGAYRCAGSLAYPLLGPYVGWRAARGKEDRARLRERYGFPSAPRPGDGPLIWMHAASVGESAAVAPLVRLMAAENMAVVMTTGTLTSAVLVGERLADCVVHQYVPIDIRRPVARFLDHWRPDVAIVAESEIWPVTVAELRRRRIPQILVNARLSDRSFRRWKAVPALAEALLENLSQVIAQSEIDGERFHLLGAPRVTVAGNLKADTNPPPVDAVELAALEARIAGRPVWAAISTHQGEEDIVAEVHRALKARRANLLTILVPRHVDRAEAIAARLAASGLRVARRSRGETPEPSCDIYLGDTMGEIGLYLRLTEVAFIGKSLTGEGGQNPLEAAMLETAILSGRYVQNFRDVYQRLHRNGGARLVRDGGELRAEVDRLLAGTAARREMIAAAGSTVREMRGALARTMQALDPFLHPLRLTGSLERRKKANAQR